MSKELTEQWREGTLPENWYYIHLKSDWGGIDCITINYCDEDGVFEEYPDEDIKEVLYPVPNYDEYKRLQEQLAIATKALNETKEKLLHVELSGLDGDNRQKMYDLMFEDGVIDKALKEMEGVK